MVGPIDVFAQMFGGLLAGTAGQGFGKSDDKLAMDTAEVAARTADAAAKRAKDVASEIQVLRTAIERLILVNRSLWEIIAESQGLTEEYLLNKIKEVDMRDGALDGRIRPPISKCASCGRVLPAGREKCIYCGTKNESADVFQRINTDSRNDLAQGLM